MKAVILANSAFKIDENKKYLASRDYLWKYSLHGLNPHNVDDYFKSDRVKGEYFSNEMCSNSLYVM